MILDYRAVERLDLNLTEQTPCWHTLNAVTLASSEGHDDSFVLVPEDILTHHDTWPHKPIKELIRADIVYFETAKGVEFFLLVL